VDSSSEFVEMLIQACLGWPPLHLRPKFILYILHIDVPISFNMDNQDEQDRERKWKTNTPDFAPFRYCVLLELGHF